LEELEIEQLNFKQLQIPDSEILDQDEIPEQYFEQLRKEYIEAWDSNDAVARHTLINEK
jgi:hypothetical protein